MTGRLRTLGGRLKHPLWGSVATLVGAYALVRWGIPHLPPLLGIESAPVPDSVVLQYMLTVTLGVFLYVSADEERWRDFRSPLEALLAEPDRRWQRVAAAAAAMAVVGWAAYGMVRPSYGAPSALRSIHPAPPDQIQFRGETMRLATLQNPLRESGDLEEHVDRGARVYAENCVPCHGDRLDGDGHFADAFNPAPLDLTSGGNLPQLSESFVFWRIAKGGPGLPPEGTPWNSAMPAWEDVLTEREIWSVIIYLYERTGFTPRATGGHGGGQEGGGGQDGDGHAAGAASRLLAAAGPARLAAQQDGADGDVQRGEEIYRRWCAECHGAEGRGDGPAADRMLPRPRDLTEARYQIRGTPSGQLPTDDDLREVIREGIPGTTMPGWPNLARSEREALVAYVKSLSRFFEAGDAPETVETGEDPGGGEEAVASGREVYRELECYRCHGQEGRGDGESAPTLEDWRDRPIRAADLTEPWTFNGGSSVDAIHARFLTGLDGTPMPSQMSAVESGVVEREELWDLAHYVRSLGPERSPPRIRDAVRVSRVEDELPGGPGDESWSEHERYWFPLSGQVVERPRQFEPMVDGVWVQGAHDGEELVLRVSWNDPSRSPDPAWMEWQRKIAEHLYADGTPIPTDSLSDRLAVQFPTVVPEGRERPYFLMGSSQRPVYLWRWDSREGHGEAVATGLGTASALDGGRLGGSEAWEAGRWSVTFRRPLSAAGDQRMAFPTGVALPVAFFAWDGNNGEDAARGSVSSWYFLILEEPTGSTVWAVPLAAVLLTGGLGLFLSRGARRRRERSTDDEAED